MRMYEKEDWILWVEESGFVLMNNGKRILDLGFKNGHRVTLT